MSTCTSPAIIDDSLAVFERDVGTGELTFVEAHFDGIDGVDGLFLAWPSVAVSPDGGNVYVARSSMTTRWRSLGRASRGPGGGQRGILRSRTRRRRAALLPVHRRRRGDRTIAQTTAVSPAASSSTSPAPEPTSTWPRASLPPTWRPISTRGSAWPCSATSLEGGPSSWPGLAIEPEHVKLLYNLGWVEAEQGHYVEAIARYGDALTADSTYVRALAARGVALAMNGDRSSAVDAFYEAINTAPAGDLFAAISAYNLQLLRGPGVSFGSDACRPGLR